MANVLPAIRMIVVASTFLRPIRSPSGPKNSPPRGRTMNAAAKIANVDSNCAVPLASGKNTLPMVVAR